ncbi:MAG: GNAT family N-acetyltransferase [Endomicrobium sp.]|jgi:GNAT superfamily N-acetyltransferase|nr:GNAT family N-acetyltransferase [Endomicrobium sp.]
MKITKVETDAQLREFIRFPYKIYSKESPWVAPLLSDVRDLLSEAKNPFWKHAGKCLFLAYGDGGNILGRIAAVIDRNYINFQDDNCGFFGFFECVNDSGAAAALYEAAKQWLRENNIFKMIGPMNPSTNDECGFLSEGFDLSPSLMMPYTHEYYLDLAKGAGLKKIKELYAYDMDVTGDSRVGRLERIVNIAKKKMPMLKIRTLSKTSFDEDLKSAISIYNCAWEKNWGFVPWTDEEFAVLASKIKTLIDPDMVIIASVGGVPVGMLVSLPDYNQVLKKLNGTLLPFGFFKFLYYKRKIDGLRLMVMGVLKEYRQKGIEAIMYEKGLKNALKNGYKHCELSWVLEDNTMTRRTAEMMNGRIYKKYSIYACDF